MLKLELPAQKIWDEDKEVFIEFTGATLQLEHSLISLSRWESIWHKPFLISRPDEKRTREEIYSYIECMSVTQSFDRNCFLALTDDDVRRVQAYIEDPMTATRFAKDPRKHGRSGVGKVITSEYLYSLMFDAGIPKECEKWHLNRLMTLIRIISEREAKNGGKRDQGSFLRSFAAQKAASRARIPK